MAEKKRWRVEARMVVYMVAHVEAGTEEEAHELANNLPGGLFDYDHDGSDLEIVSIEPAKQS